MEHDEKEKEVPEMEKKPLNGKEDQRVEMNPLPVGQDEKERAE